MGFEKLCKRGACALGIALLWSFVCRAVPVALRSAMPAVTTDSRYALQPIAADEVPGLVVTITSPPGDPSRLFVATLSGSIHVLKGAGRSEVGTFLDLGSVLATEGEQGLCSMVFHPGYQTNGQFFVFYSHKQPGSTNVYSRVSRFRVDPSDPDHALERSEEPLISQLHRDRVHIGGDMHFGPDGYLYISVGDEGYSYQWEQAGRWDINYFSGILRIDVDQREENLLPSPHPSVHPGTYRVPVDNPFLSRTNYVLGSTDFKLSIPQEDIIGEFWAVGMRNPWRMSFDRVSGDLYANDVGVASREEVNIVQRGGHHGWFFKEGTLPWPFSVPEDGLVNPIHEYEHTLGRVAITGSLFHRGTAYPELDSAYLFSDFTGQIYAMQRLHDGRHATPELIAQSRTAVTLGIDSLDGSILIGGIGLTRLARVVPSTAALPGTLSETRLFESVADLKPVAGLVPYAVNQAFWSDHALKQRWFGLPSEAARVDFHATDPWTAPPGTIWVKHFDFGMSDVDPSVRRRLETRVLVRTAEGSYGATYRWNAAQTEAFLVEVGGAEEDLVIATAGGTRVQRWRYPSRSECLACHTPQGGHALSFNTAQLNRVGPDGTNQLIGLAAAGYFEGSPVIRPDTLRAHPSLSDESVSLESRVRSYLEVNCSQCHQPGGNTRASWDARSLTPLAAARIVGEPAVHQIELGGVKVMDPGHPATSIMYRRVAEFGPLHMPPLGTFVANEEAIRLLGRWLTNDLPARPSYSAWAVQRFENRPYIEPGPDADADEDGDSNLLEFLNQTDPLDRASRFHLAVRRTSGDGVVLGFSRRANRLYRLERADALDGVWEPVDAPANRPVFWAEEDDVEIRIPGGGPGGFFRVAVIEP